jgi:hypothetical protein
MNRSGPLPCGGFFLRAVGSLRLGVCPPADNHRKIFRLTILFPHFQTGTFDGTASASVPANAALSTLTTTNGGSSLFRSSMAWLMGCRRPPTILGVFHSVQLLPDSLQRLQIYFLIRVAASVGGQTVHQARPTVRDSNGCRVQECRWSDTLQAGWLKAAD